MKEIISYSEIVETVDSDGHVTLSRKPMVIRCHCGHKLTLHSSWANECPRCNVEFNGSGQTLAPRSQWGEETGETFH